VFTAQWEMGLEINQFTRSLERLNDSVELVWNYNLRNCSHFEIRSGKCCITLNKWIASTEQWKLCMEDRSTYAEVCGSEDNRQHRKKISLPEL